MIDLSVTVASITVISGLVTYAFKLIPQIKNEWLPLIAGLCGGILGVAGMYSIPDFPAHNIMDAIAVGIVSGLASTGAHQLYKQNKKV